MRDIKKKKGISDIAIAFLVMGFIVIVALIFRPQGSINVEFGRSPSLAIGENSKVIQPSLTEK